MKIHPVVFVLSLVAAMLLGWLVSEMVAKPKTPEQAWRQFVQVTRSHLKAKAEAENKLLNRLNDSDADESMKAFLDEVEQVYEQSQNESLPDVEAALKAEEKNWVDRIDQLLEKKE